MNQFFVVIQCNVTRCGEHRQLQLVRRRNIWERRFVLRQPVDGGAGGQRALEVPARLSQNGGIGSAADRPSLATSAAAHRRQRQRPAGQIVASDASHRAHAGCWRVHWHQRTAHVRYPVLCLFLQNFFVLKLCYSNSPLHVQVLAEDHDGGSGSGLHRPIHQIVIFDPAAIAARSAAQSCPIQNNAQETATGKQFQVLKRKFILSTGQWTRTGDLHDF